MSEISDAFAKKFFLNEVNNMVGSGGEFLIKAAKNGGSPSSHMEVGDYFIGVGVTHLIETLSRNPGPDSFRIASGPIKQAFRAFEIKKKTKKEGAFDFEVGALAAADYCDLLERVSEGAVRISPTSIPAGTMILSFLKNESTYTLDATDGSPAANWVGTAKGERHWNVGIGSPDDFWVASLPADDFNALSEIPPWTKVGSIRFGLSLLPGSAGAMKLEPSSCIGPTGRTTSHDFCFSGAVIGKQGLSTPFPILMRTEIRFRPVR
jgi:hypothetical protein